MGQPVDHVRGRTGVLRLGTLSRLWLVLLAVAAATAGYIGLWQYDPPESVTAGTLADLAYRDLQLFVLEFEAVGGAPVPLALQAARFVAPAVTFVAAAFAIVGASWWLRRTLRWGYAIVVGDTAEARSVADAKRARTRRAVFEIATGDIASLRAAGVRRARTVYACGDDRDDVAANVAAALAAVSAHPRRVPRVYSHVSDPELAVGLRARRLMTAPGQRVEFFSMDELAARAHVAGEDLPPAGGGQVLVAGAGAFGRAIIVALARRWRDASAPGRLTVILVDAQASRIRAQVLDRWEVVGQTCDLVAIDTEHLDEVLRSGRVGRLDRAYICYEDEHVALRTALAAVPLWHGGPRSLVVRLSRLARHAEAFRSDGLLDNLGGRLVVANVAALAAPEVVQDRDIFAQLAEVAHARYLRNELAKNRRLGETLALVRWEDLREDFRDNNYDQACHLAVKLRLVGATVAPRSADNPRFALTEDEIERLAPIEHERWMKNRLKHGWKYGQKRDDNRRIHPDLVPWEKLTPDSQLKDREAVRAIPEEFGEVLADFGLQIVRL